MKLSVLEIGFVPPREQGADVLRQIVESAPKLEELGFSRIWLAEHHEAHFAYAIPEVLIPAIASVTKTIRVGAAGVLLHFHSPLKTAETFRMLEALYPGRIDLGVASGLTGSKATQQALRHGFDIEEAVKTRLYSKQVEELVGHCRNLFPRKHKLYNGPTPIGQPSPPLVLLGGGKGVGNMMMAAQYGTSFCYSLSHGMADTGPQTVQQYRERFQPSTQLEKPHATIAASMICAETNAGALASLHYFQALDPMLRAVVMGRPERCKEQIEELMFQYQVDEFVAIPMYETYQERIRAYEMLSEVCSLTSVASR